jgi:hypothetical protein
MIGVLDSKSSRRGWRDVEREYKGKRDPHMRVTLPKLRCLEEREEDERERAA